jgi:hypothetical protein
LRAEKLLRESAIRYLASFFKNYQKYEDESWKIFFEHPHFMARECHAIKDKALDDLVRYFELPVEKRKNLA